MDLVFDMTLKFYFYGLLIGFCLFIYGCHKLTNHSPDSIKVEPEPNVITLYYSGVLEPINATTIKNIDADGVVSQKYFQYGTSIEKDQILFIITSDQLEQKYKDALIAYLKAKKSLG